MSMNPQWDCWNRIGIAGDRSCPELAQHIHCRNCPVFEKGALGFFDRPPPAGYVEEWTRLLAGEKERDSRSSDAALVFRIQNEWLALLARVCMEVMPLATVRRVPHRSNRGFLGLVNVRGELQPCFSLADRLHIAEEPPADPPPRPAVRMIVARKERFTFVFPVEEVLGLLRFEIQALRPVPATVAKAAPEFSRGLLTAGERAVGLLDEDRLLGAMEKELQ